jgi:hypothetical protein
VASNLKNGAECMEFEWNIKKLTLLTQDNTVWVSSL